MSDYVGSISERTADTLERLVVRKHAPHDDVIAARCEIVKAMREHGAATRLEVFGLPRTLERWWRFLGGCG
jgi:hypothetical protein